MSHWIELVSFFRTFTSSRPFYADTEGGHSQWFYNSQIETGPTLTWLSDSQGLHNPNVESQVLHQMNHVCCDQVLNRDHWRTKADVITTTISASLWVQRSFVYFNEFGVGVRRKDACVAGQVGGDHWPRWGAEVGLSVPQRARHLNRVEQGRRTDHWQSHRGDGEWVGHQRAASGGQWGVHVHRLARSRLGVGHRRRQGQRWVEG